MELTEEQAASFEHLCNAADVFALALRNFRHVLQSGPAESFPAVVEAAAMAQPESEGWTPELIDHWRKNDATPAIWDALPECLKTPPDGFKWLEFAADTVDGVELCNTLMKAAA